MSDESSASVGVNPNGNPNQRDQQTSGIPGDPQDTGATPPPAPPQPTPGQQTHPTDDA